MDFLKIEEIKERMDRLERANRRWKWVATLIALAAILLLLSIPLQPQSARAQAQAEWGWRPTILKFRDVYINTYYITHVEYRSQPGDSSILVYFAGGVQDPLKLNREDGEMMRPWLEGHSIDLSPESRKTALPEK